MIFQKWKQDSLKHQNPLVDKFNIQNETYENEILLIMIDVRNMITENNYISLIHALCDFNYYSQPEIIYIKMQNLHK